MVLNVFSTLPTRSAKSTVKAHELQNISLELALNVMSGTLIAIEK